MNWESRTWQFVFDCKRDYARNYIGWYWLRVGFIRLKSVPADGKPLNSTMYDGLILRACFFWPIDQLYLD